MLSKIPQIILIMKAKLELDNLNSESGKFKILRNLCRILDIRIINIDVRKNILSFAYQNQSAFDQVKDELRRLGYPVKKILKIQGSRSKFFQNS